MKKIILYSFILGLLSSCSDFLKESSQDLMIPKSVKDYKEFFYGEGLANTTVLHPYLDLMSDDVRDYIDSDCFISNDWREGMWSYYTWQANPELDELNGLHNDIAWDKLYHKVLISNIIIDATPTMEGSEAERNDISGEAYFLRAHSYFMLVNLYGLPYKEASANKDMGVPINLAPTIQNVQFSRSTIAQVYKLIEEDIDHSIQCFKRANISKSAFRPNLATSYLLASRVALYQKKYDRTIKYADSVQMSTQAQLCDLNKRSDSKTFFIKANSEILFSYGYSNLTNYIKDFNGWKGAFVPSNELLGLYDATNDLRLTKYYKNVSDWGRNNYKASYKWVANGRDVYANAFRLAEVYLNRAEAYAETGMESHAVAELNTLRQSRFKTNHQLSVAAMANIKKAARDERRMELAFEGLRWFDLRRWGCPRIEHKYTDINNTSTGLLFVLEEGSASYTLPLPKNERDRNVVIENIIRPDSKPH